MPEIYVEFSDEDEDGTLAVPNVQDEGEQIILFFFTLFLPDRL